MMKSTDPYRILARHLVLEQPRPIVEQIVNGNQKIIVKMLKDEIRMLDWNGPIIDTLYADLHSIQNAKWLRQKIEGTAEVLIERFDFDRLIKEILNLYPDL